VAGKLITMTIEEFEGRLRDAGARTPDDVSVTCDGRRLDSKDAVLAWWAEVAADIEAEEAARRLGERVAD
jgi:hypothetical protein